MASNNGVSAAYGAAAGIAGLKIASRAHDIVLARALQLRWRMRHCNWRRMAHNAASRLGARRAAIHRRNSSRRAARVSGIWRVRRGNMA